MDYSEIAVLLGGIAAIILVIWYFFFGERELVAAAIGKSGVQEVLVTVKGGYSPDRIEVRRGKPVRLSFFRDETDSCSEQVVIPAFRIAADLPAYKTTVVEFTPSEAGEFDFTCGMNMMRGKIIVRD